MFQNYFKVAVRNMIRYRFYTLVNLIGLAVAIACVLFISLYVYDEMSYDRFHLQAGNLYRVGQAGEVKGREILTITTPAPLAETLQEEFTEITGATRLYRSMNTVFSYGDSSFLENRYYYAGPEFFRVFSYRLLEGDRDSALILPNSIVVSQSAARRYFGPEDPLGKVLHEADGTDYKVTGVMEDPPGNTHLHIDFLASESTFPLLGSNNWLSDNYYTYIRTREGTDRKELEKKIQVLLDKYFGPQMLRNLGMDSLNTSSTPVHFFLEPVRSIYLNSKAPLQIEPVGNISYIRFFSILAAFILILSFINFANLTTARSFTRAREIGMRKVMGSQRHQIIRQILTESVLLTLIAFVVGLTLVELLLPYFNRVSGKNLTMLAFENWELLPTVILLVVLMGVLAGSFAAISHTSFRIMDVLRGRIVGGPGHVWLRAGLVVFQFSIAIGLMISTIVIYKQINFIQHKDLGFKKENVLVVDRAYGLEEKMGLFVREIQRVPGVLSASLVSSVPGMDGWHSLYIRKGVDTVQEVYRFRSLSGDDRLFKTLGLEYLMKKPPDILPGSDTLPVVLNETAARSLGWKDPLGRIIYPLGIPRKYPMEITGIVKDFHFQSVREPIENLVILDHWFYLPYYVAIRLRPEGLQQALKGTARLWEKLSSGQPFSYFFLDTNFDRLHQAELRTSELFTIFSVLCIIIACVGLLGLASFLAEQRTWEMGIRKVAGAGVREVLLLFMRDFALWILLSNLIAWPVAYLAMHRWLENFAYHVSFPWWTLPACLGISFLAGMVTVAFQVVTASSRQVAETIHHE